MERAAEAAEHAAPWVFPGDQKERRLCKTAALTQKDTQCPSTDSIIYLMLYQSKRKNCIASKQRHTMKKPHRIPYKTYRVMQIIRNHVSSTGAPITYELLAKRIGLMRIALFAILRKIGRDAVTLGTPLLDAWVVNEATGMPGSYFFEQKIELGYLDKDVNQTHFWFVELDKFWK